MICANAMQGDTKSQAKKVTPILRLERHCSFFEKNLASFLFILTNCKIFNWGRGDGQAVSVLVFYSYDPILNPADVFSFFL